MEARIRVKEWVLLLLITAGTAQAQMWPMTEGTQEIHADGLMQWDGPAGQETSLSLGYGYFLFENVEAGMRLAYRDDGMQRLRSLAGFVEQNYGVGWWLTPYIGGSLGLVSSSRTADSNALALGLRAGVKYFMVQDLALDLSLSQEMATGKVYLNDGRSRHMRTSMDLGLRFFF